MTQTAASIPTPWEISHNDTDSSIDSHTLGNQTHDDIDSIIDSHTLGMISRGLLLTPSPPSFTHFDTDSIISNQPYPLSHPPPEAYCSPYPHPPNTWWHWWQHQFPHLEDDFWMLTAHPIPTLPNTWWHWWQHQFPHLGDDFWMLTAHPIPPLTYNYTDSIIHFHTLGMTSWRLTLTYIPPNSLTHDDIDSIINWTYLVHHPPPEAYCFSAYPICLLPNTCWH